DSLEKMLPDPDTRLRKMPLGVPYPLRREQEVVVLLPDSEWSIPPTNTTVECDAFSFHYSRTFSGSTAKYHYDCNTKTNLITAQNAPEYLKKLEEMQDLLGDTLQRPDNSAGAVVADMNWPMVVVAGFGCLGSLAGGLWIWHSTRPTGTVPPTGLTVSAADLQG